jgi:anti-sigma regulatory factor (Ser/Thr protein kinase)
MPLMDGFELFKILEDRYPQIKHILMTSYDIDRYISLIRKYNIGNILVKGPEFSFSEVCSYVKTILSGDIFGLQRFFNTDNLQSILINSYAQAKLVCAQITESSPGTEQLFLEMAIDELISNAFFHAVLNLTGVPRELWTESYDVQVSNAIKVTWGFDTEKVAVAVEDPRGNLKKMDVLKWLDEKRELKPDEEEHGRGLFLVRRLIDRLIINIDPGKRTECIIIQYFNKQTVRHNKPLLIHEL